MTSSQATIPFAASFVQELRRACEGLAKFPRRFPLARNLEAIGIRHRAYRRYVIFYRADEDRVLVLRIIHGSRAPDDESFAPPRPS